MTMWNEAGAAYNHVKNVMEEIADHSPKWRPKIAMALHHFRADRAILQALFPGHIDHGIHRVDIRPGENGVYVECGCHKTLIIHGSCAAVAPAPEES